MSFDKQSYFRIEYYSSADQLPEKIIANVHLFVNLYHYGDYFDNFSVTEVNDK